jgi:hypothetical protein
MSGSSNISQSLPAGEIQLNDVSLNHYGTVLYSAAGDRVRVWDLRKWVSSYTPNIIGTKRFFVLGKNLFSLHFCMCYHVLILGSFLNFLFSSIYFADWKFKLILWFKYVGIHNICLCFPANTVWQYAAFKAHIIVYNSIHFDNIKFNVMSSVFWNKLVCSPLKVNLHFGGKCRLHLQGWRISRARNQCESRAELSCWFLAQLILRPRRWKQLFPLKRRLTFNGLHSEDTALHNHHCGNLKSYIRVNIYIPKCRFLLKRNLCIDLRHLNFKWQFLSVYVCLKITFICHILHIHFPLNQVLEELFLLSFHIWYMKYVCYYL